MKCAICDVERREDGAMCAACGRAYDRWNATSDGTMISLIVWVAARARRFERRKARGQ